VTAIAARVFEITPDAYPAIRHIFSINTYGFFAVSTSCNAGQGWARGTGFLVSLSSSYFQTGGFIMVVKEEFKVKNASGHTVILQNLTTGISYLDFGMTHLPRDFLGYRVKYTDRIAEPQSDGTFKLKDNDSIYSRI
jgi:hypothetical protein